MDRQKKSFLVATITIFLLMVFSYVLTLTLDCKGLALYKFVLSPILVLGSSTGSTIIAICIFLLIIGGISNSLNKCGFMEYTLNKLVCKYGDKRYKLLFVMVLFFMLMGSLVGSFEEVVPITPIVVSLMISLGFDALTGIAASLLAVGCGFASGVFNPFNIGVAQGIVGLPMFSGVSLRLLTFVLIYVLLMAFILSHAKRIQKNIDVSTRQNFVLDENKEKAFKSFIIILSIGLVLVLSSSIITILQDFTLIIIALAFLFAGIVSTLKTKTNIKTFGQYFKDGAIDLAPSILLILMASSIKYIMEESAVLDTIVSMLITFASKMNRVELILFIYLVCLVLEIFVPSGSAKAFLLMPLLAPIATTFNVSLQLCVLAYAFGDGFSNVFYPTNPALIISLSLVKIDYKTWFKYSAKFQLINLVLTSGILLLGLVIGY